MSVKCVEKPSRILIELDDGGKVTKAECETRYVTADEIGRIFAAIDRQTLEIPADIATRLAAQAFAEGLSVEVVR